MTRFGKLELGENSAFDDSVEETSSQNELEKIEERKSWMQRADDSRRMGQYETALRFYSRALEEDKSIVTGWVGQIQMLIMLQEYPEAELWATKSLELFPGNGELMAARAQAMCRQGKAKQSFASADGALNQQGDSAYRWMVRGELLLAGKQKMHGNCFDKALQIDADWLIPIEIALIYLNYRQPSNALNRARSGIERGADAPYAWYITGMCQKELGLTQPALRSFETAINLLPGYRDAEIERDRLKQGGSLWKRIKGFWSR